MCARVLNGRKRDVLYALESNNRACVLRRITEEIVRRGSLSANYTVERKKHPSSRKRIHSRTVNVAIAQSLATYLYIHTDRHAVQSLLSVPTLPPRPFQLQTHCTTTTAPFQNPLLLRLLLHLNVYIPPSARCRREKKNGCEKGSANDKAARLFAICSAHRIYV